MTSMVMESKVALDRITKYLLSEDIHLDEIQKQENNDSDVAIKVENGNFYWLTEEEKKLKKEKEKEEKEKLEKEEKENNDKKAIEDKEPPQSSDVILDQENPASNDLEADKKSSLIEQPNNAYNLILEDINIMIKKGSFVAILGE